MTVKTRKKIGLLGGSFNPAHEGHVYISNEALNVLGLDEVWWLVSPQNPLKSTDDMMVFEKRLFYAKKIAAGNKIEVSDIESRIKTRYTANTLKKIKKMYPENSFVWLMGADNLFQIPKWKNWEYIFNTVPIAVFDRKPYCRKALGSIAAEKFACDRLYESSAAFLPNCKPPAWVFMHIRCHPASATEIRANRR